MEEDIDGAQPFVGLAEQPGDGGGDDEEREQRNQREIRKIARVDKAVADDADRDAARNFARIAARRDKGEAAVESGCAFRVTAPGEVDLAAGLGGPGIPLYRPAGYKFFDSLGVEEGGNIAVATIGESGISVVSPAGELVEFVPTPDPFTTNICWGGADRRTAYITLAGTGQLIAMPWARPGLKLEY